MKYTLIAAMSIHGVIGSKNDIPWKCREDFQHFKFTTVGHTVIMGRRTFESLGCKPLAGRLNIVVGRSFSTCVQEFSSDEKTGLVTCTDLDLAFKYAQSFNVEMSM